MIDVSDGNEPVAGGRRQLAVEGAMEVLAALGARGLTHREVARHLGWPIGSISNYFRRRNDILTAIALHILRLDTADLDLAAPLGRPGGMSVDLLADRTARLFGKWMSPAYRIRMKAGAEVLLESARNPEVGQFVDARLRDFEALYQTIFAALGAADPVASSRSFRLFMSAMYMGVSVTTDYPGDAEIHAIVNAWVVTSLNASAPGTPATR